MKIIFTDDGGSTRERARYMRGGLIRNYHSVKAIRKYSNIPLADVWFHGLSHLPEISFPEKIHKQLDSFKGKIVFFQNDDGLNFEVEKIPLDLIERTSMFLRNVWPSQKELINPLIRDRIGLLNPLLKPEKANAGKNLLQRPYHVTFYGVAISDEQSVRIEALRLVKKAGISLNGGIFINPLQTNKPPSDLTTDFLPKKDYLSSLENTRMSLVLHGNNPLTFRLFESFSRRCLVLAQDLSEIWFADCGLKAGVHYVAIKKDFSDLIERITYYTNHIDEAQAIADAGFNHFKKYFQFRCVNLPQPLFHEIKKTWKHLVIGKGDINPYSLVIKWMLPTIDSL